MKDGDWRGYYVPFLLCTDCLYHFIEQANDNLASVITIVRVRLLRVCTRVVPIEISATELSFSLSEIAPTC
jgi:hypothetical protein